MTLNPAMLTPTDHPEPGTFEAILGALEADSAPVIGKVDVRPLVLPVRDDAGQVRGGLWASTLYAWLYVQMLVVPAPVRRRGVGRALMLAAEAEAIRRGCQGAYVDTFSFQAEPFYLRLGYRRFGVLPGFPPGHARIFLAKDLSAAQLGQPV